MSRISELINYTRLAIDDIERAIRSHFIETENVPLSEYGNLIRGMKKGSGGDSSIIPVNLILTKKPKLLTGVILYDYTPIKILKTEKKIKNITGPVIHDYAPKICHISEYEPINIATLTVTLELNENDYVQENAKIKEEI